MMFSADSAMTLEGDAAGQVYVYHAAVSNF